MSALRDQDVVILQSPYVQRLFKHKRGLVAAYRRAGFELICLHDGTTTVRCSATLDPTELIDMYTAVAGKRGCVAVRRARRRNILIDVIAIINVIGDRSKYRFCAFFNADNIFAVHADAHHVVLDIDAESG
jgi:hypothetical protein